MLLAVAVGFTVSLTRILITGRNFQSIELNKEWLVIAALVPQIIAFFIPGTSKLIPSGSVPFILIPSMACLLLFAILNINRAGFQWITAGVASNLVVISANRGWMPINVETLKVLHPGIETSYWNIGSRLGSTKDMIMSSEITRLSFLSDRFTSPTWLDYKFAFSLGDLLISVGIILLLWSLSRKELKQNANNLS